MNFDHKAALIISFKQQLLTIQHFFFVNLGFEQKQSRILKNPLIGTEEVRDAREEQGYKEEENWKLRKVGVGNHHSGSSF